MKTIEMSEAARLVAEGERMPVADRLKLQQERLRELVAYARENSPYLSKLYANVPEDFKLTDLPIVKKEDIVANYDDYVTDSRIHMQDVIDYIARDDSRINEKYLGDYSVLHTSGSTGKPLPMVRDDYHNKIHGMMLGMRLMRGINMEDMSLEKYHHAAVIHMASGVSSYNGYLRTRAANPECADNLLGLSCLESVDRIVEKLNEFQPVTISGYPSSIVPLAAEQLKGNLKLSLKGIAFSAEMLTESEYNLVKEAFGCPIMNNYCMTEGGEVAMTHGGFHLHQNEDWVIVEPVDKDMNLLGESDEWSAGLLITDLSNYVQPMIRYYVSDVVRIRREEIDGTTLPVLEIRGRKFGSFTICGKTLGVIGLWCESEVWPGVVSVQFVQTDDKTIEVRTVCSAGFDPEQVMSGLSAHLKKFIADYGCPEGNVTWSKKPFIHNQKGGKTPLFVKI